MWRRSGSAHSRLCSLAEVRGSSRGAKQLEAARRCGRDDGRAALMGGGAPSGALLADLTMSLVATSAASCLSLSAFRLAYLLVEGVGASSTGRPEARCRGCLKLPSCRGGTPGV